MYMYMYMCMLTYLVHTAHAKEALELAKMQEHTEQIKHQEEIRVSILLVSTVVFRYINM